ncbi:nuclear transcription factor Y subunit gamma isoform X2 [Bicyclus anynana]|uniref:Nuclear transcription factor Y subunit gamma n=1 Tax=Bicyclus anynana TaxID=110368 RepID=A0A6J1P3A0_BICAN|nr:nuclear transcription factor Y subunit gamma isoform X2 [Bicyclus anynana]
MSVCFFVPTEQAGTSAGSDDNELECIEDAPAENIQNTLQAFWGKVNDDMKKITSEDFKTQVLPLARIKKIMKLDEEVKMISAEAPVLFAKAAEIFIHELTLRAWSHTEDNKRRTLQRNDIAMAISKSDQFDFLIDIVPRHEVKPSKPRDDPPRSAPPPDPMPQQQAAHSTHQQYVVQSSGQVVQQPVPSPPASSSQQSVLVQQVVSSADMPTMTSRPTAVSAGQQPVTLVQQIVNPAGEVQNVPILLTQAQLNMIRLQVQNNPNQPIIIQAQPAQPTPQIIQVPSQTPHQPHQIFVAQVSGPEES